ncbi:FAD-binding domain-containing protein [Pacificimonas pallii]|uniref:FAD-binding domain-containing protein n=1 Tax=Pacificimonas pallii TaxID=2827236 RepID=UPI0034E2586B
MSGWTASRAEGLDRLDAFLPRAGRAYQADRNHDLGPGQRDATSLLSPYLARGLVDEAEVIAAALAAHGPNDAGKFISEVFWRIYFQGHLEWKPDVWRAYVETRESDLAALDLNAQRAAAYEAAIGGRTGIDAFDTWVKELIETGFLHNHTRMWFSSIWIFTLRLPWTLGADFFLRHLLDGDAASNTLNWRWTAGLHTQGKTYLATKANIRRYTSDRFAPEGLAEEAPSLEDAVQLHRRKDLALADELIHDGPFALLLHEQDTAFETLDLGGRTPDLVIGVSRAAARSSGAVSAAVTAFTEAAVDDGLRRAEKAFGCPVAVWTEDQTLGGILAKRGLSTLAVPWIGEGWLRDALREPLNAHAEALPCARLLRPLQRETWPHAKAGYFGVRKKIARLIAPHLPKDREQTLPL